MQTNNTNAQVQAEIKGSETNCALKVNDDKDLDDGNFIEWKETKEP